MKDEFLQIVEIKGHIFENNQLEAPLQSIFEARTAQEAEQQFEHKMLVLLEEGFEIVDLSSDNQANCCLHAICIINEASETWDHRVTERVQLLSVHIQWVEQIMQKARHLQLTCTIDEATIRLYGHPNSITELKDYLSDLVIDAKKMLYPKHWNFDAPMYAEIVVSPTSREFTEVRDMIHKTVPHAVVEKLTRIQNHILMDKYLDTLLERQELGQTTQNKRMLLFHGTRTTRPHQIYGVEKIGFDTDFAKAGCSFGKGMYFARDASYSSRGYAHTLPNGNIQMFLVDVFVGIPLCCSVYGQKGVPEGFDSIFYEKHGFYVVYKNFQSYPLYLIELKKPNYIPNVGIGRKRHSKPSRIWKIAKWICFWSILVLICSTLWYWRFLGCIKQSCVFNLF